MVRKMKRGAVILDFAINEGGCVETSRLTPTEDGVFVQDGIVHYATKRAFTSFRARRRMHIRRRSFRTCA
jgi:NAD/NADP transhydrogenase alpha subunit